MLNTESTVNDELEIDIDIDLEISKAHTESFGWHMGEHINSNPFETDALYVCDYRKPNLIPTLGTAIKNTTARNKRSSDPIENSQLLVSVLNDVPEGAITPRVVSASLHYIESTQSYRVWMKKTNGDRRMHGIINIYPVKGDRKAGIVRSIIRSCDNTLLTPSEVMETSLMVLEQDKGSENFKDMGY
jgi:hypothetical protein